MAWSFGRGKRKGGKGAFEAARFSPGKKPSVADAYAKVISSCEKEIGNIGREIRSEKKPGNIVDLNISLHVRKINLFTARIGLFEWLLKNPEENVAASSPSARKKMRGAIAKAKRAIKIEEREIRIWKKRNRIKIAPMG